MKEFFLLLFFGKSILLTPSPITLGPGCVELELQKTLRVINEGASLQVLIHQGPNDRQWLNDIDEARKKINGLYPNESINAQLMHSDGSIVNATNYNVGIGNEFYDLELTPRLQPAAKSWQSAYQVGDKFTKVKICSEKTIPSASIYWHTASD